MALTITHRVGRGTEPRTRERLARDLLRWLRHAAAPRPGSRRVPPAPIDGAAEFVGAIVDRLRGAAPIRARGVELLRALLTDGGGPLYRGRGGSADALRAVLAAL